MRHPLHIGVDFDGVIVDTLALKQRLVREMYDIDYIPDERFRESQVVADGHLSREKYRALMNRVCGEYDVAMQASPVTGSVEALQLCKAQGHTVTVITAREGDEFTVVKEWLRVNQVDASVYSTGYMGSKIDFGSDLDVFIDDGVGHTSDMVEVVPFVMLFHTIQNATDNIPEKVMRVHSWNEILEHLDVV